MVGAIPPEGSVALRQEFRGRDRGVNLGFGDDDDVRFVVSHSAASSARFPFTLFAFKTATRRFEALAGGLLEAECDRPFVDDEAE